MFIAAKYVMTATSVTIVVVLNYVCIYRAAFPTGHLLGCFAGCFAAVVVWELSLLARIAT